MDHKAALEIVTRYIAFLRGEGYLVSTAYLFGSVAMGTCREDSDIDVAIVLKQVRNGFETQVRLMKLRRDFDLRIEPHPFSEDDLKSGSPLIHEILANGIQVA
jgi:uncharacterized protein